MLWAHLQAKAFAGGGGGGGGLSMHLGVISIQRVNPFSTSSNFCGLLIIVANSLNPDHT